MTSAGPVLTAPPRRTCKYCGAAEQTDALGWSNLATALEICADCINEQIQRVRALDARSHSRLSPEAKQ